MLRTVRSWILSLPRTTGVFGTIQRSRWRAERLLVLCYHGISLEDEHEWAPGLFLNAETFERRLRVLRERGYHVLPLGEGLRRLYEGSLPPASVVVTFDDGYYNFFSRAYSLLERYGVPATVYWTTYYANKPLPVFSVACSYLLWKGRSSELTNHRDFGIPEPVDLAIPAERHRVHRAILAKAERDGLSAMKKQELLERLAAVLKVDFQRICRERTFHLMTGEQAAELAARGLDIQLHTHRHRAPLEEAEFRKEIRENREFILRATGYASAHFCYPSGQHDRRLVPWLEAEGVASAVTCEPGLASRRDSPFLLPRYLDAMDNSETTFESWLCGVRLLLSAAALRRSHWLRK